MLVDALNIARWYQSDIGQMAQSLISKKLDPFMDKRANETMVGYGYPLPYLSNRPKNLTMAMMPDSLGGIAWPDDQHNRTLLVDEHHLPLGDICTDRILVIHGLEHSKDRHSLMNEFWRVLNSMGRMTIVVPSRRGLWAKDERTPFAVGSPYSSMQLRTLGHYHGFELISLKRSLLLPAPLMQRFPRLANKLEAREWYFRIGGVLIAEFEKKLFGTTRPNLRKANIYSPFKVMPDAMPKPAYSKFD